MSLHYIVKYECQKWHQSDICIGIIDKPQGSTAKHLRCDELLYYTLSFNLLVKKISKIGENLLK